MVSTGQRPLVTGATKSSTVAPHSVLLVGERSRHRVLARELADLGCRVEVVSLAEVVAGSNGRTSFDAVCIDAVEPGDRNTALHVAEWFGTVRQVPTVLLTAPDDVDARVVALSWSADALGSPPDARELVARAAALIERERETGTGLTELGDMTIDWGSRTAIRDGRTIEFTGREVDVLRVLVENIGRPVAKTTLLARVWDGADRSENAVEAQVSALRRKFDDAGAPNVIQTVFGTGYMFTPVPRRRGDDDAARRQLAERERALREREEAVARRTRLLRRMEQELGRRVDGSQLSSVARDRGTRDG